MHMHKYFAEAVGTFALSLAVLTALHSALPVPAAILAALTVGIFVYAIGPISGCHINPAVTVAALSLRLIKARDAAGYVIAQALGATVAFFTASLAFGAMPDGAGAVNDFSVLVAEILGTFFLTFGIAAVIFNKVPHAASGLTIGGSLLLGVMIASGMGSLGILNPAVAFALGEFNALYLFGPLLGGVLGMWAYRILTASLDN